MTFQHFFKRLAFSAVAASAVACCLSSCDEGKHDYYYCTTNKTDKAICVSYQNAGEFEMTTDILLPGMTDTICVRKNVSGDDVWDIETSAELFQVQKLECSIADSTYTDNLRLRSLWGKVNVADGNGVYKLDITPDLFTVRNVKYFYFIQNDCDYILDLSITSGAYPGAKQDMVIGPQLGSYVFWGIPVYSREKYVKDVYDTTSASTRITQLTFSNVKWISMTGDTIYARNFNANRRANWTFSPEIVAGDSAGVYKLQITPETLE